MARDIFDVELGLAISAENGSRQVMILSGTAIPDGTSGKQQVAPIGSLYLRSGTGEIYQKIANAGAPADYEKNKSGVELTDLSWRNEKVRFATNDTVVAGSVDITSLSDNDDMVYGDIAVGEYLIGDLDGSPALFEITATPGAPNITVAAAGQPIASNDTFVVQQYLPDPTGQENQAIVHIPTAGSAGVKIADIDWNFADGINIAAGYAAQNGTISNADSVNSAIEKLDGNQQDLQSLSGVAQGSTVLGAFVAPGSFLLGASETIKSALQKLADYFFGLRVIQATGVTTSTAVDSLAHATYKRVVWHVEVFEEGTPANREGFTIEALTDGTTADSSKYTKLKVGGGVSGLQSDVAVNGANLELQITASNSSTVNVRRLTVN